MPSTFQAEEYTPGELGSFGKASCMLLRQFQFPHEYEEKEHHTLEHDDRLRSWDFDHTRECFKRYTDTGEMGLEGWLRRAKDDVVLAFLSDVMKQKDVAWTGYRICGGVNRGNGYPVWIFELFAKKNGSQTKVYAGPIAPNVKPFGSSQ